MSRSSGKILPKGVIAVLLECWVSVCEQPRPVESRTEYTARRDAFGKQAEQAFESTEWTEK